MAGIFIFKKEYYSIMEADYDLQSTLGDVPPLDRRIQMHHDAASLLAIDVQRGRKTDQEADIILSGLSRWTWRNRFPEPDPEDPIAA